MAVLWPSEFQGGSVWLYTEWPWRATVTIGNRATVGAALLAVLLAWRSEDPAAPHLAAALALGALAFGIGSHPAVPATTPFFDTVVDAAVLAAGILGAAAFMRFSMLYPTPLTLERMQELAPPGAEPDNALRDPDAQLPMERVGTGVAERLGRRARTWTPGWSRRVAARLAAARRRHCPGLRHPRPAGRRRRGGLRDHRVGRTPAWGWALLRFSYAGGDPDDRRKILWILQGFLLLIGIPALVVYGLMVPTLFSDGARLLMLTLWPPAMAVGALAQVICLAIAVFWAGALDPGRALRSTVVYGGLGLVLTVVFALMENVASEYVVAFVGLPDTAAVILSTAMTAVVFSALHRRFERAASGLFREGGDDASPAPPPKSPSTS